MQPLLTMHTTEEGDRVWITCSCGYESEPRMVNYEDERSAVSLALIDEGRAHFHAAHEPAVPLQ